MYQRFWNAYELSKDDDDDDANHNTKNDNVHSLGVVFHGTPSERVAHILKHGLNPKYRRTQAFGRGEYFSKDPGLATTYCGLGPHGLGPATLIVYLVFIPEDQEKYYSQRDRDILCIEHVHHELPIGVLQFEAVDPKVIQHTQELRIEQKELKEIAVALEKKWKVAVKAAAVQAANNNDPDKKDETTTATTLQIMEEHVRDAWRNYYRTKWDENRNTLQHLTSTTATTTATEPTATTTATTTAATTTTTAMTTATTTTGIDDGGGAAKKPPPDNGTSDATTTNTTTSTMTTKEQTGTGPEAWEWMTTRMMIIY